MFVYHILFNFSHHIFYSIALFLLSLSQMYCMRIVLGNKQFMILISYFLHYSSQLLLYFVISTLVKISLPLNTLSKAQLI